MVSHEISISFHLQPNKKATFRLLVGWSGVSGSWADYCYHIAHCLCVTDAFGLYALGIGMLDYISLSIELSTIYDAA